MLLITCKLQLHVPSQLVGVHSRNHSLQKQKDQLSLDIPQVNVHSCRGAPIGNTAEKQQLGTFEKVKHAASTELGWSVTTNDEVLHCNMHRILTTRGPTETPKCIAINADLTWACFIHGSRVPLSCHVIETFPDELEHHHLHPLLETVRLASVCTGNQDPEYTKMAEVGGGGGGGGGGGDSLAQKETKL